jgi:hypothetical protein
MELTPIGWLTFSQATELYENTWLGERPSMSPDQQSRLVKLWLRGKSAKSEPLTDAESQDLKRLTELSAQARDLVEGRVQKSRFLLHEKLNIETVASMLLHRATGHQIRLPGRFWASSEATRAIAGQRCKFYLNNFWWEGPVLISEAGVIKAAAPSQPVAHAETQGPNNPVDRTSAQKKEAFGLVRDLVVSRSKLNQKTTQAQARDHVEAQERANGGGRYHVADADPGEWWAKLRDDPQTKDWIAKQGRPRKPLSENTAEKAGD